MKTTIILCIATIFIGNTLLEPIITKDYDSDETDDMDYIRMDGPIDNTPLPEYIQKSIQDEWNAFKIEHNKEYKDSATEEYRKKVYLKNKLDIENHNKLYEKGQVTYELQMTHFGDTLEHEHERFESPEVLQLAKKDNLYYNVGIAHLITKPDGVYYPDSYDWRDEGLNEENSPVRIQLNCGASWAFTTCGTLEGHFFQSRGVHITLSPQHLIDCTRMFGNLGCQGGLPEFAFRYIIRNNGIEYETSYPYRAKDQNCQFSARNPSVKIKGQRKINRDDDKTLMWIISTMGPVTTAIDPNVNFFRFYRRGVYHPSLSKLKGSSHGLIIMGYSTDENGLDYWLVKNSWGPKWGIGGYARILRNGLGSGFTESPTYPIL